MNATETVKERLDSLRRERLTQREQARRLHLSHTYLNLLMSGKRDVSQITLGTFDRMFPAATVSLDGNIQVVADHGSNAAGRDLYAQDRSEALRARIILDLLDLAIDSDTLTLVLKTVKAAKAQ